MNKLNVTKFHVILTLLAICLHLSESVQAKKFEDKIIFEIPELKITQISDNTYVHTSYLQTESFGKVACNGMLVLDAEEVIVFDPPTNDSTSEQLIQWIQSHLNSKIIGVVVTHFHNDCLGGLNQFKAYDIPTYALNLTTAKAVIEHTAIPEITFTDSISLPVGNTYVTARYFGEGHTADNIIGYFPKENIMFGGCLIKEMNASKGYLGDANPDAWSETVRGIKKTYPKVKTIVPGHGHYGNKKLLDYTIQLFNN